MLVFTRKVDDRVCITLPDGSRIWLTVVDVDSSQRRVRLGFEAPCEIEINREEVQVIIDRANAGTQPTETLEPSAGSA